MSGGKNIPAWLSDKKKKALRKDEEYRRRIELIQVCGAAGACVTSAVPGLLAQSLCTSAAYMLGLQVACSFSLLPLVPPCLHARPLYHQPARPAPCASCRISSSLRAASASRSHPMASTSLPRATTRPRCAVAYVVYAAAVHRPNCCC